MLNKHRARKKEKLQRKTRSVEQVIVVDGSRPKPLIADRTREAVPSIRAYRYQFLRTIYAWLELRNLDLILIEGSEDFDHLSDSVASPVQVKDTNLSGSVTLRSEDVVEAIDNYWDHRTANPGRNISFHFLTTSDVGLEQGSPFGQAVKGIELWERARSSRREEVREDIAAQIRSFLLDDGKVGSSVRTFLTDANPRAILEVLIANITWHTAMPGGQEVESAIKQKLERMCLEKKVSPRFVNPILDRLEKYVHVLAGKDGDRSLSVEDLQLQIEDVTSIPIPGQMVARFSEAVTAITGLGTAAFAEGSQNFAVRGEVSRIGSPPPVPLVLMTRRNVTTHLAALWAERAFINIQGATGTGKSTQAALLASSVPGERAWVSCRDLDGSQLRAAIIEAGKWLDQDRGRRFIVLDDVDFLQHIATLESVLPGLCYMVTARAGAVVATSQKSIPQRLRNWLNLTDTDVYAMPLLDTAEIEEYLEALGCGDNQIRSMLATLVYLKTRGHPQLVAAHGASLAQAGFPRPTPEDLLQTPQAINEIRTEARLFLANNLSDTQRELLYRLSLLVGFFSRDRAILVAGIELAIANPGDVFDQLVGPWLERATPTEFRVSPLIQNAGHDANGLDWARRIHGSISSVWVTSQEQTPWTIASILVHAVMGDRGATIARVSKGLFHAEDSIWSAIASADAVFVFLNLDRGQTFSNWNPFYVFCARFLQLKLAVWGQPQLCEKILDRVNEEFPQSSQDQMKLLMRNMLLGIVMTNPSIPLPISRAIDIGLHFTALADTMPNEIDGFPAKPIGMPDLLGIGGEQDVANMMAVLVVQRVKTIEDLQIVLTKLDGIAPELRRRCLRLFQVDEDAARQLVDAAWLTEHASKDPRWPSVANVFSDALILAERWGETKLAQGIASALGRTLHENLEETDRALFVLSEARRKFGTSNLVVDAEAKILSQSGRQADALTLWTGIFDSWEMDSRANKVGIGLAMQNAANTAAALGNWPLAAQLYSRAADATEDAVNSKLHIGLRADAGYAFFRSNDFPASLKAFDSALEELEGIPNSTEDIRNYYLHKMIGHVLTWISTSIKSESNTLSEPVAGCCSNTDPPDQILQLNPTPLDFSWAHLLALAELVSTLPPNLAARMPRLQTSSFFGARMYVAQYEIARVLESGPCNTLVPKIGNFIYALLCFNRAHTENSNPWEANEVSSNMGAVLSESESEFWSMFLVQGLFAGASQRDDIKTLLQAWKASATEVRAPSGVHTFIDSIEAIMELGQRAMVQFVDEQHSTWERLAAAAIILGYRNPHALAVMAVHMNLITLRNGSLSKYFEPYVSAALTTAWLVICDNPFALRSPRHTVPAIVEASCAALAGWKKVANLLLAGSDATGVRLPANILDVIHDIQQ